MIELLMKVGDKFPYCLTVVDIKAQDSPCLYTNNKFSHNTGYSPDEAVGKNLKFLQGKLTDPKTVEFMKSAFKQEVACIQDIVNYKKDGTPFLNRLLLIPINSKGQLYYLGFQHDITDLKGLDHNNNSLSKVNDAEIKHVINNALCIILGSFVFNSEGDFKLRENIESKLTDALERINEFILKIEDLSEFESFRYLKSEKLA